MRRFLATLTLGLAACTAPAQLVVVVETNLDVPGELDVVEVSVQSPDGVSTTTPQPLDGPDAPRFPLTLGVSPSGETLGPITVTALGRRGGAEVVRQSARVTLVAGETRTLHLVLYRSCVGRTCEAGQTCDGRACVAQARSELPEWTGTPPTYDPSDACLALPWDVDGDGRGSVACGGDDCDDDAESTYRGAEEACNGVDDDCDGDVDEGCDCTPLGEVESCTTSCGSTGRRTCAEAGWQPCEPPAETCGGVDDDCDGLVDEGFAYAAGAPVELTDTRNDSLDPSLVWAGDRYALAWHDRTDALGIHFQTFDADGAPLGPAVRVSSAGRAPAIAWSGRVFGIAYWHRETVSCGTDCAQVLDRIRFVVVGPSGEPIAGPVLVAPSSSNPPRPRVVWDGSRFVLGYRGSGAFLEARDEAAMPVGGRLTVSTSRNEPFDLALHGAGRLALAYAGGSRAYFTQGDLDAFPSSDVVLGDFERAQWASLRATGDGFLATVVSLPLRRDGVLHLVPLDPTGTPRGTPIVLTMTYSTRGILGDADPAALAAASGQAVAAWVDAESSAPGVYLRRSTHTGVELQPRTRVPGVAGAASQPTLAAASDGFGVVFVERPGSGNERLLFARFACE
ncbi:MAG: hypothetical protein KF729_15595 [Sandaracinaceae bacterium]|nr:hypothetical protein [Sandaracinaceae bacterium]